MKYNNPDYTHYVVTKGKIESGWEYREDAKDHVSDSLPDYAKPGAKVVAKSALSRHSIDPTNDDHWHTQKSLKEADVDDEAKKNFMKDREGVPFEDADEYTPGSRIKARTAGHKDSSVAKSPLSVKIVESFYDDKKYTHYVVARGKIESGHESKEDADFHHSDNLPKHLKSESRVVSRDELKKGHLDASNKDHWAKTSDLKESVVAKIMEGDMYSFNDIVKNSLGERAQFVIENCDKSGLLEAARGKMIAEMRDAPDQAMYPLTRREVEKLLTTYERRAELDTSNNENIEARSEDGMKRARWYAPDVKSDFKYDVEDDMFNPDTRPAALMPYDTHNVKTDDSEKAEDEKKEKGQDYSGEDNLFFHSAGNM